MSREWEERLKLGKVDMTRILQKFRTEGHVLKYRTSDGRLLTWASEPESLAFCIPCMRLMKLDGRPGQITNHCR